MTFNLKKRFLFIFRTCLREIFFYCIIIFNKFIFSQFSSYFKVILIAKKLFYNKLSQWITANAHILMHLSMLIFYYTLLNLQFVFKEALNWGHPSYLIETIIDISFYCHLFIQQTQTHAQKMVKCFIALKWLKV